MNFSSAFEASRRDRSAPVGFLVHRSTRGFERRVHRGLKQHENLLPALFPNEVFCVRLHKSFSPLAEIVRSASVSHCSARVSKQPAMVKTRIACYFDVPRADNRSDYHNFVDVRSRPTRLSRSVSRRARVGADAFRTSRRPRKKPPRLPRRIAHPRFRADPPGRR